MRSAALLALGVLAACGTSEPCDGKGTCVTLVVRSATFKQIDQLELDILFPGVHSTVTTHDGTHVTSLPLESAIVMQITSEVTLGVVAAGKLSGNVLGTAAGQVVIAPDQHAVIALELADPEVCQAGALYCGGDKLDGDPQTLYVCNAGAGTMPTHCPNACIVNPSPFMDACR